jgi:hypothetical protein
MRSRPSRVRLCAQLQRLSNGMGLPAGPTGAPHVIAPVQALMQQSFAGALAASLFSVGPWAIVGIAGHRSGWPAWISRLDQVNRRANFALRVAISGYLPSAVTEPYRVDFSTMTGRAHRRFDVSTQRSGQSFEAVKSAYPSTWRIGRPRVRQAQGDQPQSPASLYLPPYPHRFRRAVEPRNSGVRSGRDLNQPPRNDAGLRTCSAGPTASPNAYVQHPGARRERFSFGVQSLTRFETKFLRSPPRAGRTGGQR